MSWDDESEEDYWPEAEECQTCGFVDYWCDLCGYHGHTCEGVDDDHS